MPKTIPKDQTSLCTIGIPSNHNATRGFRPHRCAVGLLLNAFVPSCTYLGGAVGASLVGGLPAQLADGIVGTLGGLPAGGRRRAEATAAAAAASGLGQHLARAGRFYADAVASLFHFLELSPFPLF